MGDGYYFAKNGGSGGGFGEFGPVRKSNCRGARLTGSFAQLKYSLSFAHRESDACYVVKDIQTATPEVNKTEAVLFNTSWWPSKMADIAPIEEEGAFEVIDDGVPNGKYLLGLSPDMTGYLVMGINNATGLVDKYAYITNNIVNWGLGVSCRDCPVLPTRLVKLGS